MAYWLIKSDPETYGWLQLKIDKSTTWDGVRNYQARNNIREMKKNDILFFYHSNSDKAIIGTAKVIKEAFQDPTTDNINWLSIEIKIDKEFKSAVGLAQIKSHNDLQNVPLIKHTRLSVMPIKDEEAKVFFELSK
ncbi:MAG: EVE domain-containing protein [Candidatus Kapabacteria bacterium]|jgi:predicted RNA-binding protein with PUA-like domain|nr:EVE domain-containing protein [Candidatus Kapabacteria bacterium]